MEKWKAHDFYLFGGGGLLFCFSSEAYGTEAFITPQRRTYLKTDFNTRNGSCQKTNSLISKYCCSFKSFPSPHCPFSLVVSWVEPHETERRRRYFARAVESSRERWHLYRINHSYRRDSPLDRNLILFYTEIEL